MHVQQQLDTIMQPSDSLVCVGLDSASARLRDHLQGSVDAQFTFNKAIIDATHDLVCAYKPNSSFYEACGTDGIAQLHKTCTYLKATNPEIFLILDAKRGDGPHASNDGYVTYAFDYL